MAAKPAAVVAESEAEEASACAIFCSINPSNTLREYRVSEEYSTSTGLGLEASL